MRESDAKGLRPTVTTMHRLLAAAILAFAGSAPAQLPEPTAVFTWGSAANNEDAFSSVPLAGGTTAVVSGLYRSTLTVPGPSGNLTLFSTNSSGLEDCFLGIYRPGRQNFELIRMTNGNNSQLGPGSMAMAGGDFFFIAAVKDLTFFSFGTSQQQSYTSVASSFDPSLSRYSGTGTLRWVRTIQGDLTNLFRAMAEGPDGSVILTGNSRGTITLGAGTPTETALSAFDDFFDWFVCRYDVDGNLQWAIPASGALEDKTSTIAKLPNGDFAIGGQFESTLSIGAGTPSARAISASGGYDNYIATVSAEGEVRTAFAFGGDGYDDMKATAVLPDGDLIVSTITGPALEGPFDMRFLRIDPLTGTERWAVTFANTGTEMADSILYLPDWDRVLLAVQFTQTFDAGAAGVFTSRGSIDSAVAVMNPETGAIESAFQIGGTGTDELYHLSRVGETSILGTGSFTGTMQIGNGVPNAVSRGGFDAFVITMALPVAPAPAVGWFLR
jgi:hypothetical protein